MAAAPEPTPQEQFYAHLGSLIVDTLATAISLGWDKHCANGTIIDPALQRCAAFYSLMYHNVHKNAEVNMVVIFTAMKKIRLAHPVTTSYIVSKLAEIAVMVATRLNLDGLSGRNIPAQKLYNILSTDIYDILEHIKPKVLPTLVGTARPDVYDPEATVTISTL